MAPEGSTLLSLTLLENTGVEWMWQRIVYLHLVSLSALHAAAATMVCTHLPASLQAVMSGTSG